MKEALSATTRPMPSWPGGDVGAGVGATVGAGVGAALGPGAAGVPGTKGGVGGLTLPVVGPLPAEGSVGVVAAARGSPNAA
ncbi:hypothetical protein ABTK98_19770, partial [Acinetobacter baumannii]